MMSTAMPLIEHYVTLKSAHLLLVASSVSFFACRGVGTLLRAKWPMRAGARRLSVMIDMVLLASGASLWWLLALRPDHDTWLGLKLVLIALYIVLGSIALKQARSRRARAAAFAAALTCIALIVAVARTHDPLGPWRLLRALASWFSAA
jgi:uncharacterized membrane protein SirB2